jgi:uncharacterized protein YcfJ
MKKLLFVSLLASPIAFASEPSVQHHYKDVTRSIPYQQCHMVDVPIYGNISSGRSASRGDVLEGMLIGGVLGKAITGHDKGAAVGAVIGGMESTTRYNERGIVGYKQREKCVTRYDHQTQNVYSHSTATFNADGRPYTVRFQK